MDLRRTKGKLAERLRSASKQGESQPKLMQAPNTHQTRRGCLPGCQTCCTGRRGRQRGGEQCHSCWPQSPPGLQASGAAAPSKRSGGQ